MVIGLPRNLSKINFVCPTNDSRTQFHLRCERKEDEKRGDTLNGWQVTDSYSFNRDTPCLFIQPATFSGRPGWKINARNIQIVNKPATLSHVARFIGDVKEFRPLKQRREIYRDYVLYGIALPTFCSVNEWDSSRSSRTILILNIPLATFQRSCTRKRARFSSLRKNSFSFVPLTRAFTINTFKTHLFIIVCPLFVIPIKEKDARSRERNLSTGPRFANTCKKR